MGSHCVAAQAALHIPLSTKHCLTYMYVLVMTYTHLLSQCASGYALTFLSVCNGLIGSLWYSSCVRYHPCHYVLRVPFVKSY